MIRLRIFFFLGTLAFAGCDSVFGIQDHPPASAPESGVDAGGKDSGRGGTDSGIDKDAEADGTMTASDSGLRVSDASGGCPICILGATSLTLLGSCCLASSDGGL